MPTTLPTYDEVLGRDGVTNENYNDHLLSLVRADRLNVLTIHAEVEGIICAGMFEEFVKKAKAQGVEFVPLKGLLESATTIERGKIAGDTIPGREGAVACQVRASHDTSILH